MTNETTTMQNANLIRVTAATSDEEIKEAVELATGPERLEAYNRVTGKEAKKFATKAAGIKQTVRALIAERDRLRDEQPEQSTETEPKRDPLAERLDGAAKRRHKGGAAHDPSKYRAAYVREQLLTGRTDYDALVEECRAKFPDRKTERKHIIWDRWKLRQQGHNV